MTKVAKKVAKSNARFKRMTKADQRVAIAKDALKWLDTKRLVATTGQYFCPRTKRGDKELFDGDHNRQLRDINIGKCDVCAIGAVFFAKANVFDKVTASDVGNEHQKMLEHFAKKQLALIELAFEGYANGPFAHLVYDIERVDAYRYHALFDTDDRRLRAIMRNIIRNKGTFKPEDKR